MINHFKRFRNIILLVALYLSLPAVLIFTNPQNMPLPLLILPIILLFLIIYFSVYAYLIKKVKRAKEISKTRLVVISGVAALMPVLLIVLASIRQFTFRDILLSVALVVCVSWYLLKVDFLKSWNITIYELTVSIITNWSQHGLDIYY